VTAGAGASRLGTGRRATAWDEEEREMHDLRSLKAKLPKGAERWVVTWRCSCKKTGTASAWRAATEKMALERGREGWRKHRRQKITKKEAGGRNG
jgi:hypothetical protein